MEDYELFNQIKMHAHNAKHFMEDKTWITIGDFLRTKSAIRQMQELLDCADKIIDSELADYLMKVKGE
jgi:hypothetical protein